MGVNEMAEKPSLCWDLKLLLNVSQHSQFIAELQGGQHRVLVGQGQVGRTGQSSVGVYPRSRVAEGVVLLLIVAGVAATEVIVWMVDASPFTQQRVNNLVFLAVRSEDQGSDVMGEPVTQDSGTYTFKIKPPKISDWITNTLPDLVTEPSEHVLLDESFVRLTSSRPHRRRKSHPACLLELDSP